MKLTQLGSNQTVIWFDNGIEVFFSYNTPVAAFVPQEGYLITEKKWSVTTSKHVNKWIGSNGFELCDQSYLDSLVK